MLICLNHHKQPFSTHVYIYISCLKHMLSYVGHMPYFWRICLGTPDKSAPQAVTVDGENALLKDGSLIVTRRRAAVCLRTNRESKSPSIYCFIHLHLATLPTKCLWDVGGPPVLGQRSRTKSAIERCVRYQADLTHIHVVLGINWLCSSGWWFGTFVIFPDIGKNTPN